MYRQFILLLFALIYCVAVAQSDTYVIKYTDKGLLTLELPASTKVTKGKSEIIFTTPDVTISLSSYKVKSFSLVDDSYLTDSIPSTTPYIKCKDAQITYCNPRQTQFTQILRSNSCSYRSLPPTTSPLTFDLAVEPKNTYTLDFGPEVKVKLNEL